MGTFAHGPLIISPQDMCLSPPCQLYEPLQERVLPTFFPLHCLVRIRNFYLWLHLIYETCHLLSSFQCI